MKPISLLIPSLLLAACASSPPPAPAAPSPPALDSTAVRHDIEQADARLADAIKRGDVAAWSSLYTPDASFFDQDTAEPLRGRAAIGALIQPIAGKVKDVQSAILEIEVHGDTAYEIASEVGTLIDGGGWRGRSMAIWKQQPDGRWLISRSIFQPLPPPPTAPDHETRVASVRKHLEENEARLFDAAKHGDAPAMAALYAPDAVLLPEQEEPVRGRAAILASLSWMKKAKVKDWAATIEELDVQGDTANELGTEVVTLSFGPKAVTTRMKYLDVWKEQPDGAWLLYRRMFSSNAPQK
jgi:uncharacterized protein (TIGR02246 family)